MAQEISKADMTGRSCENFIETSLRNRDYEYIDRKKFKVATYLEQPIYSKQFYVGQSIYGSNLYCDYILYHPTKYPDCLAIDVKQQRVNGSNDEKFPYFILNIREKNPYRTILVLEGKGSKIGAEKWIRSQVDDKLIHVFTRAELQNWVKNGNL